MRQAMIVCELCVIYQCVVKLIAEGTHNVLGPEGVEVAAAHVVLDVEGAAIRLVGVVRAGDEADVEQVVGKQLEIQERSEDKSVVLTINVRAQT